MRSCFKYSAYLIPNLSFPDIDECALGTYICDINAYCENTIGSYDCICVDGYVENGTFCMSKQAVDTSYRTAISLTLISLVLLQM